MGKMPLNYSDQFKRINASASMQNAVVLLVSRDKNRILKLYRIYYEEIIRLF